MTEKNVILLYVILAALIGVLLWRWVLAPLRRRLLGLPESTAAQNEPSSNRPYWIGTLAIIIVLRACSELWREGQHLTAVGTGLLGLTLISGLSFAIQSYGGAAALARLLFSRAVERVAIARVPAITCCALLVMGAWGDWEGWFYQLLRIVVFLSALYLAFSFRSIRREFWVWLMAAATIVFNPIVPVELGRSNWQYVDGAAALLFASSLVFRKGGRNLG